MVVVLLLRVMVVQCVSIVSRMKLTLAKRLQRVVIVWAGAKVAIVICNRQTTGLRVIWSRVS